MVDLMTMEEAALYFNKNEPDPKKRKRRLENWLYNGVLPKDKVTTKIGGIRFFVREWIDEYINNQRKN